MNSKVQTVINIIDLNKQLKISQEEILKKIGQWLSEGSRWMVDKINNHYLNVVKYKPKRVNHIFNFQGIKTSYGRPYQYAK